MKTDGRVTITAKTAKIALDNLSEWLSDGWELTAEIRQMIIALDELTNVLQADEYLEQKEEERQERVRKMQEEYRERKAAEEAAKLETAVAEFLGKGGN